MKAARTVNPVQTTAILGVWEGAYNKIRVDRSQGASQVGWKAYRVSLRQPGCRNGTLSSVPAFLCPDTGMFFFIIEKGACLNHVPNQ